MSSEDDRNEVTIFDIPFSAEKAPRVEVKVGEKDRYLFDTRTAAIAFALKSGRKFSQQGIAVSINIEGADHVWRLFDPFMRPRT